MSKWKKYKLSEYIVMSPKVQTTKNEEYSFVGMEDLSPSCKYVEPNGKRKANGLTKFQNGDSLFAKITPCLENGKIAQARNLVDNIGVGSTEFFVFRGKHKTSDNDFIYYLLRSYPIKEFAIRNMTGSAGHQRVPSDVFDYLYVKLPDYDETVEIGKFFSTLDSKIDLLSRQNQTLENIAQIMFKRWFVDFEFPYKDGKPYKSSGGKMVEGELGEMPEGWKVLSIEDVSENYSSAFDFSNKKSVVFVNTGDVLDGKFLHNNYVDINHLPGQAKKAIEKDNILYSEIRPINRRFAYVNFVPVDYVVSTKFMVIKHNNKILPRLLYLILKQNEMIREFNNIAETRSGTFPQITFESVKDYPLCLPNIDIQKRFMEVLSLLMIKQEENYNEIKILTNIRDTLLPKLMSGQIRVKSL